MKGPAVGVHAGQMVMQGGNRRAWAGCRPVRGTGSGSLGPLEALDEGSLASREIADRGREGGVLLAQAGHRGRKSGLATGGQ